MENMTPAEINDIKVLVNQYGMPIIAACGMGYFIYFVWKFVTENINSKLDEARKTMISLIDRIGMLDNDLIRLEQKIATSIEVSRGKSFKSLNAEAVNDIIAHNNSTINNKPIITEPVVKNKNKSSRKQYR